MTDPTSPAERPGIFLPPDEGRPYPMGRIRALFKADGDETAGKYSISEWWLDPHTKGPGAHSHEEDDIFHVLEGTMCVLVGDRWIDAPAGSFVLAPGGLTHDFENRTSSRAGVLNFSIPGDFEKNMPAIVDGFAENPPGNTGVPAGGSSTGATPSSAFAPAPGSAAGSEPGPTTPEELLRQYEAATAAHDLEGTLRLIDENAVYWFSDGAAHLGREAVERALRSNFEAIKAEHYALSDVKWLARSPDLATCTFRFEWSGVVRGERMSGAGRGTTVVARRGASWVVLHEHLSR